MSSIPSQLPQLVTASRTGALQALALQSGQVLDARIIGPAPNGGTQVEIKGQMLNLLLPVPVKAGETLKLEVQGAGQQMRLALQAATAPPPAPSSGPAPMTPPPAAGLPIVQGSSSPAQPVQPAPPPPPAPATSPLAAQAAAPAPVSSQPAAPMVSTPAMASATPGQPAATPANAPVTNPTPAPPTTPASVPAQPASAAPRQTTQPLPLPGYPQAAAAPAMQNPVAAPTMAAVPAQPPAAQPVPAAIRPVLPPAPTAPATGNPSQQSQPQAQPAMPTTPQAALAQMVQASVPRQGPVTNLTAALADIAGKVVLPEPVARAAQQVLAGRVVIDAPRFDGASLQAAIKGSGVFQEATLARGQLPLPQADMKTALLSLRQTLTTWLGQQAPLAAVAQIAPPLKGNVPRARAGGDAPPIDAGALPKEVGRQLLERTDSALSRIRLHQQASLPDQAAKTADWSMDMPVLVGQQQTLLHIQIHRDQQSDAETPGERGWQMRFAISLPEMGEVGAQVSLRAGNTGVMLWATEPAASGALAGEVDALRESLSAAGLRPGAVIVRHGEPPTPAAAPSGHFVDSRT